MGLLIPTRPITSGYNPAVMNADLFRKLPVEEQKLRLSRLPDIELQTLLFDWEFWRRENQLLPAGNWWSVWLVLAGRGFGKTRVGAETIRYWIRQGYNYVNLIGPTADDIRDAMIEGESGVLAICPPDERPEYLPSRRQLRWPNGAVSLLFSAEEPERLRNKQHMKLWCDELAAWRYPDSWDQAQFGLRLGDNPQAVVTTTPRPTKLVKELIELSKDRPGQPKTVIITRGTSYQNKANLSAKFYAKIITKYEGTRLGRQELQAEVLEDNPNALFWLSNIEKNRVYEAPKDLERIVVPIDPATTSNELSDETGIVPVGRDKRNPPHFYVLEDISDIYTPDGWAQKAVSAYHALRADRIIGETNNGGEMIEACIRHVDENVSYKEVHASRGKVRRAEPIGALYEQNRVHHVGILSKLEDQMTNFNPATFNPDSDPSPDRMDSLVWGITELADAYSGDGFVEYLRSGKAEEDVKKMDLKKKEKVEGPHSVAKVMVAEQGEGCPACSSKLIVRIAGDYRCQQCGKQWPATKRPETEFQTRNQLLAKLGSSKVM